MSEPQGSEGTTRRLPVIEKDTPGDPGSGPGRAAPVVPGPPPAADGTGHRFWSARRIPAAVVARPGGGRAGGGGGRNGVPGGARAPPAPPA
ncbi:hypothetical protein ACFXGE_46000, partial [Streptomyces sp. NPDC059378]